jgi:hypothetical protein
MTRRTREQQSTKSIFNEVVFSSLAWPWKTVRLERDTLQDYCQRPSSATISIAELYHENSKLFLQKLPELAVTRIELAKVQREFLKRRSSATSNTPAVNVPSKFRQLLSATVSTTPAELYYATELRLVLGEMMLGHDPLADRVHLLKRMSLENWTRLRKALSLVARPGEQEHNGPVLLIVCNFARYDLLFGSRGYRRTLIEAGRVADAVLGIARQHGLSARLTTEFADRDLDCLAEADGIEEGVISAIELGNSDVA